MNLKKQIFSQKRNVLNTFIGFNAAPTEITTAAELASFLIGVVEEDILFFNLSGNNIEASITKKYTLGTSVFQYSGFADKFLYYIDVEGRCKSIGSECFYFQNEFDYVLFPKAQFATGQRHFRKQFFGHNIRFDFSIGFTTLTDLNSFETDLTPGMTRLWLGRATKLGSDTVNSNVFADNTQGLTVYVDPSLETVDGGSPDPDLVYVTDTAGGTVVYVDNLTPPSAITNLASSNITATTVDLTFTIPSSTNTLDFYEVFIDDGTEDPLQLYRTYQEITASGDTVTGLITATTYKIKVYACDEYWNRSKFSNEIEITTL